MVTLKVHKIEIFLASILKFVLFLFKLCQNIKILPKKSFDWAIIGGGAIFFSFMNPLYEPILVFPKFDPITAPGMALRVNLGPTCQNLFPLV